MRKVTDKKMEIIQWKRWKKIGKDKQKEETKDQEELDYSQKD